MPKVVSQTQQVKPHSLTKPMARGTNKNQSKHSMLTWACLSACDELTVMEGKLSTQQRLRHFCHRAQRVKLSTPQRLRHYSHRVQRVSVEDLTPTAAAIIPYYECHAPQRAVEVWLAIYTAKTQALQP